MYLVIWTDGHRKNFLYEEQDHGVAAWSLVPDDAIIFDTLSEAVESMLDVRGPNLRDLNVIPYVVERIAE